jgi:hypothetical protein
MKKALKQLLNALDKVFENHEEVGDTDVREQMFEAVLKSFIRPEKGYKLPREFGMFSDAGNKAVHAALSKFLSDPDLEATSRKLKTPKQRLDAFQNEDVESSEGNTHDEYFGYCDEV